MTQVVAEEKEQKTPVKTVLKTFKCVQFNARENGSSNLVKQYSKICRPRLWVQAYLTIRFQNLQPRFFEKHGKFKIQ